MSEDLATPTRRVFAHNYEGGDEFEGSIPANADLDGVVPLTKEDDGQVLLLNGWLWSFEDVDPSDS